MLALLSTVSTFTGNDCLLQHVNFHAIGSGPPCLCIHVAMSIKVLPEQSGKVEYERERLPGNR